MPSPPPSPSPFVRSPTLRNTPSPSHPDTSITLRVSGTSDAVTPELGLLERHPPPLSNELGQGSLMVPSPAPSPSPLPRSQRPPSAPLRTSTSTSTSAPSTPTRKYRCPLCPGFARYNRLLVHLNKRHAAGPHSPLLPLGTEVTWCNDTWYTGPSLRSHVQGANAWATCAHATWLQPPSPSPMRPRTTRSRALGTASAPDLARDLASDAARQAADVTPARHATAGHTTANDVPNSARNSARDNNVSQGRSDSALRADISDALNALNTSTPTLDAPLTNPATDTGTRAIDDRPCARDIDVTVGTANSDAEGQADVTPAPLCGQGLTAADLYRYPVRHRLPFGGNVHAAFRRCLTRVCEAYNADGTDAHFHSIAVLPKLTLGSFGKDDALTRALDKYPSYPTPPPPIRHDALAGTYAGPGNRVHRLIKHGRMRAAMRALKPAPIARPGPETDARLAALHPAGPERPFPPARHPHPALTITDSALDGALATFDKGTAAGADGWTVPLLTNALAVPAFRKTMFHVAGRMLKGDAPCRALLCASTLTPLQKFDSEGVVSGVRPIAVGSLVYRLLTKAILRAHPIPADALEKFQFGVGSPGGVEPLLQWLQGAVDDVNDDRVLTCLDFSNAFNRVDRRLIAKGVLKRAPRFYKLATWAYGAPSDLLTRTSILQSTQGVRQGDPLGPALFSMAIAPLLRDMHTALGHDYDIVAYHDDVMILGPGDALDKVQAFLHTNDDPLVLNAHKCLVRPLSEIRTQGVDVLGAHVGPLATRRAFLDRHIDAQDTLLETIVGLPKQDALLLLRACLQHNLTHLLRQVEPEGALDRWLRRDRQLLAALARLRGPAPSEFRDILCVDYDDDICALPIKNGGLGIYSHVERAPVARAAATEAASATLSTRLKGVHVPSGLCQKDRHTPLLDARLDALWQRLDAPRRVALLEGASRLGRRWITVLPWSRDLEIRDDVISAALFARALAGPAPGSDPQCGRCTKVPSFGHVDTCASRNTARTHAHEVIKNALKNALESLPASATRGEPEIGDTGTRNDVRIEALSSVCPIRTTEYDVTSTALSTCMFGTRALRGATMRDTKGAVLSTIEDALVCKARAKWNKQTDAPNAPLFVPVVFSAGGITLAETETRALTPWRTALSALTYQNLINVISCALLLRRAYCAPRALKDRLTSARHDDDRAHVV